MRSVKVIICCLLPLAFVVLPNDVTDSATGGDADAKARRPAGTVVLSGCHIKLINQVTLASDRPGIIDFVEPTEGSPVQREKRVAGLMDAVARATLATAEKRTENDIEVRFAEKAAELAEAELEKSRLANKGYRGPFPPIPEIEIQRLKLAVERSTLQTEKAEHDLNIAGLERDEARAQLKTYQIKAPFDGIVTRIHKQKGEAVRQGEPILDMASTQRVRVEGEVGIQDVFRIEHGSRVVVQIDDPDISLPEEQDVFEGRIVFVDLSVQPLTHKVRVWAEVANRENILRAGLTAQMTIFPKQDRSKKAAH